MNNPLVYQLYMLQIENYDLRRYFALLSNRGFYFPSAKLRKSIKWTGKAVSIFASAVIITLGGTIIFLTQNTVLALFYLLLCLLFMPAIYSIIVLASWPLDSLVKNYVIWKARSAVNSSNAKVVAIAGSYGKTSMKNIIFSLLAKHLKVISTPDSVNTPIGIARFINKNLKNNTEVIIVEMGEHYQGDIAYLCRITPPDIAVVTGINEAHLERLKNLKRAIATIFEIVENAKKDAFVILNKDDANVTDHYKTYLSAGSPAFFTQNQKAKFDTSELVWRADIGSLKNLTIPFLGKYAVGYADCAIQVAGKLGLSDEQIKSGLGAIKPIEHRLQPIKGSGGVLVIDDSYNGNPAGAKEAIEVLGRFKGRKFYITPGLVETGDQTKKIHLDIGRQLADVADKVMLIKNSVTPFIAEGLKEKKFAESNIIWFENALVAHQSLGNCLKEGDTILFQNDWSDEYV